MISRTVLISILVFFFIRTVSLAMPGNSTNPKLGGQCDYQEYPGKAEVISVTQKLDKRDTYIVKFHFYPQKPIKQKIAHFSGKEHLLLMDGFRAPTVTFVHRHGIRTGKQFDCIMKVITKGTCTPVLFEFPGLDMHVQ